MDIKDLFKTQSVLFESGRNSFYRNVIFLETDDKAYLRLMGQCMFEGFPDELVEKLSHFEKFSYLCKSLTKESVYALEDFKKAYWKETDNIANKIKVGTIVEKEVVGERFYSKPLYENHIVLYFPVLMNWVRHYTPKMENETFETREIVKSLVYPLQRYAKRKNVLFKQFEHDLTEQHSI